jgi:sulfate/thiosulfate transport system ATP-binding protein
MAIEVKSLSKSFGGQNVVSNVSFNVNEGELVGLLGPSGGGKSTILRMIAGLETPTSGDILLNGLSVKKTPPQNRGIGMVFQHYALFKHMTVAENIAFGLRVRKSSPRTIEKRVAELLELMGLGGLGQRYPQQLSGGQRQRVALARSLAPSPSLLLLDEPFGAIDAKIRRELRDWLRKLHNEMHMTSIFVTHDQEEAMEVADRILIINQGEIEQVGTPKEIYDHPQSEFVANFVGPVNILPAEVKEGVAVAGVLEVTAPGYEEGDRVNLVVRPEDVILHNPSELEYGFGEIKRLVFLGDMTKVEIEMEDSQTLIAHLTRRNPRSEGLKPGDRVGIKVDMGRVFPRELEAGIDGLGI